MFSHCFVLRPTLALVLLLLLPCAAWAQRVSIAGTATVEGNSRNTVQVSVNDTVRKYRQQVLATKKSDWEAYEKLMHDPSLVFRVKDDGRFSLVARLTDSLYFNGYRTIRQAYLVADLLKRPAINIVLRPEPCLTYVPCRDSLPRHYVFIGEKIQVEATEQPYYCDRISMDSKFNAVYKILENVYGNFANDTIAFAAYDHYGRPGFSKNQHVLLFVSEYCQQLIHQKYQYYPVYKTVDNQWAAPYAANDYANLPKTSSIRPHLLEFREPVVTDIAGADPEWVARTLPAPYYRIEKNKAIAVYGNYVAELLELKKQTVLKERGVVLK